MAVSFPSLLLLSLSLTLLTSLSSADKVLINSICSKAHNPPLCFAVFKGSTTSNRVALGQTAVGFASRGAILASDISGQLVKSTADPGLKQQYGTCLEVYSNAIDQLNECRGALSAEDYGSVNIKASAAFDYAVTCSDEAPSAPPQLKQANQKFEDYVSIVLSLSYIEFVH